MSKRPTNLLYADTVSRRTNALRHAKSRKVRSRVSEKKHKIGIFDISAKAGLLFNALEHVSRRQSDYTFYPIEAQLPMGLGIISETDISEIELLGEPLDEFERMDLQENIAVDEFFPLLEHMRNAVGVDVIVGLVHPMLLWTEGKSIGWNYFSIGQGECSVVSSYGVRQYSKQAKRPFEASIAMMAMAQVWANMFEISFHDETLGCPMDFNQQRGGLVESFKKMTLCSECLDKIPSTARDGVEGCLAALKDYKQ